MISKMNKYFIILIMLVATNVHAWGQPATATTTIEARVTHWTEDPCDFPQHHDKCEIKQELNIPIVLTAPTQITTSTDGHITNYE